jgi:pyruvate dehydrogenase E2 component (dihydrolipoamide acetyltransferase)
MDSSIQVFTGLLSRHGETFVDKSTGYSTASIITGLHKTPIRMYASGTLPPHKRVELPALSPTMESGTLISWEKQIPSITMKDIFTNTYVLFQVTN